MVQLWNIQYTNDLLVVWEKSLGYQTKQQVVYSMYIFTVQYEFRQAQL